jgi:outer membrane immunogenic protein
MRNKLMMTVTSIAATMAMVGAVQAADIAEPVVHDWSGFYIGAHVGYGEAYYEGFWTGSSDDYDPSDLDLAGIVGGLHAGFNHQMDSLILGIEADITFVDWSDSQTKSQGYEVMSGDVNFLASLRGRLGWAFDDILLYGTAGIALSDASYEQEYDGTSETWDFNDIGGVVGGGAEWAMSDNFSLRAEGLYYFFNDKKDTSDFVGSFDSDDNVKFKDAFVVRVGASYYFR